jgi:hypothetical protein
LVALRQHAPQQALRKLVPVLFVRVTLVQVLLLDQVQVLVLVL